MILGIDTSSKNCSLALWDDSVLLASFDHVSDDFLHAEILHLEIERLLENVGAQFDHLSGIVVGSGPGSYTGLRIGVSAAKGLAMALNIPLYAVSGLALMFSEYKGKLDSEGLVVMDARRNEVFGSWFNALGALTEPSAMIIDESFIQDNKLQAITVIGENASKLEGVLPMNSKFFNTLPSIKNAALHRIEFAGPVDLAYFEPTYVKPFIPTISKK